METVVVTGEFHESFVFCDFEQILMSSLDENLTQANNRDMSAGETRGPLWEYQCSD